MVRDCKAGAGTHSSLRCTQTFCLKNYCGMYISHVCVCARVCVWARAIVNMWCQGFYFHYEGSGNWTQVIILGSYGAMPMSPIICVCVLFLTVLHMKSIWCDRFYPLTLSSPSYSCWLPFPQLAPPIPKSCLSPPFLPPFLLSFPCPLFSSGSWVMAVGVVLWGVEVFNF